jgi:bacterial/archaeal transporter family-2 protein
MRQILLLALMFCGGIAVAVQPSINGRLAQKTGIVESSCISFWIGALALLGVVLLSGANGLTGIGKATWWELTGGFLGAFFVTCTIVVVPRLGTVAAMTAIIAAQLMTGVVLDHFGLFRLQQVPLDAWRAAGLTLLMAGAALVLWR